MGASFTVTDSAQSIYPDGQQSAFIIYNQGPYSVYVDSESSIGAGSIAIPPTGWLSWDAGQPLWVKRATPPTVTGYTATAQGPCTISITRNHATVAFTNSIDKVLGSWVDNKGSAFVTSPLLECTAFNTLILNLASPQMIYNSVGEAFTTAKTWAVHVHWYDAQGNHIEDDFYTVHGFFGETGAPDSNAFTLGPKMILPVKGTYTIVTINAMSGSPTSMSLLISASTRVLDKRIFSGYHPTMLIPTVLGGAAILNPYEKATRIVFDGLTGGNNFMIPCLSDTLQWAYTTSAGGTAGSIVVTETDGTRVTATQAIAGGSTDSTGIFRVPMDEALLLIVTPVLNAGVNASNSRLVLTWL